MQYAATTRSRSILVILRDVSFGTNSAGHSLDGLAMMIIPCAAMIIPCVAMIMSPDYNQDTCEHHYRNIRGASGDWRNPSVAACRTSAQGGTVIRFHFDKKPNSGSAPIRDKHTLLPRRRRMRPSRAKAKRKAVGASAPDFEIVVE